MRQLPAVFRSSTPLETKVDHGVVFTLIPGSRIAVLAGFVQLLVATLVQPSQSSEVALPDDFPELDGELVLLQSSATVQGATAEEFFDFAGAGQDEAENMSGPWQKQILNGLREVLNGSEELDLVTANDSRAVETLAEKIHSIAGIAASVAKFAPELNSSLAYRVKTLFKKVESGSDPSLDELNLLLEVALRAQSANTLSKNRALLTASDLALITGVGMQEDLGPKGVRNVTAVFQGDMLPEAEGQLLFFQADWDGRGPWKNAGQPWTGGEVHYCFAPDVSDRVRHLFTVATSMYTQSVPCLSFADVGWKSGTSEDVPLLQACQKSPAIFVTSLKHAGCYSYVGMTTMRSQQLQLNDPGCMLLGTVMHELGHAIGLGHEQSRSDRYSHVLIHWDNIQADNRNAFAMGAADTGLPYDYLSLMHFDAHAFAVNSADVSMNRSDGGGHWQLGQRVGLSQSDILEVAAMYLPEVEGCSGSALQGTGCVDRPHGSCDSRRSSCDGEFAINCCACGGGFKAQCYRGLTCPHADSTVSHAARVLLVLATTFFACCLYTARKQG